MSYLKLLSCTSPRRLTDIVTQLPNMGVGARVTRAAWAPYGDSYWHVTAVKPKDEGKSGKVWGVLTWRGQVQNEGKPQQIRARLKSVWRWMPQPEEAVRYRALLAELREINQQPRGGTVGGAAAAAAEAGPGSGGADSQAAGEQPAAAVKVE